MVDDESMLGAEALPPPCAERDGSGQRTGAFRNVVKVEPAIVRFDELPGQLATRPIDARPCPSRRDMQ